MQKDFVTVLTHSANPAAKRWNTDGSISPYGEGKHFKVSEQPVTCIEDLAALLAKLERKQRSFVIRGQYRGSDYEQELFPEEHKPDLALRRLPLYDDVPHHWVLIEIDNFEPLSADPVRTPEPAITEYIETHLPPEFHKAGYHWQLSNSAGHVKHTGKLKAHVWFWLEQPATSTQLRAWAEGRELDKSVFNAVQAHYTAMPMFAAGIADPVIRRSGTVQGAPAVALDLTPLPTAAPEKPRLVTALEQDPIAQRLYELGLVKSKARAGHLNIECPCSADHTGESSETTSVYYLPNTGGYAEGTFNCKHEHCAQRPQQEFRDAIGFSIADEFEDLSDVQIPDEFTIREHDGDVNTNPFRIIGRDQFLDVPPARWLIKHVLQDDPGGIAVVYGPSSSGKSFIALDMVACILRGVPWRGKKVTQGRVVYVAAEGVGGFRNRIRAYENQHPCQLPLDILPAAPNILDDRQYKMLCSAAKAHHEAHGPSAVCVFDTMAQITAGGDDNSGKDMMRAVARSRNVAKILGATALMIHHSGKDIDKGARGHSSLRAAVDTELRVERDSEDSPQRRMTVTKQKELYDGEVFGFQLGIVTLGADADGDPITSCFVEHDAVAPPALDRSRKPGAQGNGHWQKILEQELDLVVGLGGQGPSESQLFDIVREKHTTRSGKKPTNATLREAIKGLYEIGVLVNAGCEVTRK